MNFPRVDADHNGTQRPSLKASLSVTEYAFSRRTRQKEWPEAAHARFAEQCRIRIIRAIRGECFLPNFFW
jgi:hypothetical protein